MTESAAYAIVLATIFVGLGIVAGLCALLEHRHPELREARHGR